MTNSMSTRQSRRQTPLKIHHILYLFLLLILTSNDTLSPFPPSLKIYATAELNDEDDGLTNFNKGNHLFQQGHYEEAATHYWRAVLLHSQYTTTTTNPAPYEVQDVFVPFIKCYSLRGKIADGLSFIAMESWKRGQIDMAKLYVQQTLAADANHEEALMIQELIGEGGAAYNEQAVQQHYAKKKKEHPNSNNNNNNLPGGYLTPEAHEKYNQGTEYFSSKKHSLAAQAFEESCQLTSGRLGVACTNAAYCRTNILQWGENGTQFDADMKRITAITQLETRQFRRKTGNGSGSGDDGDDASLLFEWDKSTSVHPHMMLGYPVDSMLKRYVAESFAALDERTARVDPTGTKILDLPSDLPFDPNEDRVKFIFEQQEPNAKIRVAFVACGFNSKAVMYLSHDMFRFFDRSKFEVHIFSLGPPDNDAFINIAMRGVDWRQRVKDHVHTFHDVQHLKNSHVDLARYIHAQSIHILIEWDGYARQGERAQGLFALRPAPVQILHQEFLGTSGATYVDYIVTDKVTSPVHLERLYTEAFMYMPNHFFSKGHALQVGEVKRPTYEYVPMEVPAEISSSSSSVGLSSKLRRNHVLGTGSPQENRCLSSEDVGPKEVSFVFCNFNKFLKNNPETVRSWIEILQSVPNSLLCLLENPSDGIPNLRSFIRDTINNEKESDDINSRIHFLPWERNPFDHQMRNQDFCNLGLDSHPYNGHTTAQDALYGGVPIVTRSDGDDMSSRVSTSANIVLGLEELNAYGGVSEYKRVAISLGNNATFYERVRKKLIDSCLQTNPMHPYWDVPRYVRNFQSGLEIAWKRYLNGVDRNKVSGKMEHIEIEEDEITKKGTYEDDLVKWNEMNKKIIDEKKMKDEL